MNKDPRPSQYRYWDQLVDHIEPWCIFDGELHYPRQLEIHLPGNHLKSCQLGCPHCAGKYFDKSLGTWELDALEVLNQLKGAVPYHIYGGAYTEPLLNPYFMTFLRTTKRYGNHFGIHTNGCYLSELEDLQGWLTELKRIATDGTDYLSVSIDAGLPWAWALTKGTKQDDYFYRIVSGLRKAARMERSHAIRLCYLISPHSDNLSNFQSIISIAEDLQLDSLRFSIPFACYNQSFDKVREYKRDTEIPNTDKYYEMLEPYLSSGFNERPYIFYTGPEFTDIDKFDFKQCLYGYYQLTFGADGYYYKCSTTATPTMQFCRLGKITGSLDRFHGAVMANLDTEWDAGTCFDHGARCNRMGLEINRAYVEIMETQKVR